MELEALAPGGGDLPGAVRFFFTTVFSNQYGLVTGMIGSLGYWLEQQGVRRGSQPQYYYMLTQLPVYEFLPMIGAMLAGIDRAIVAVGLAAQRATVAAIRARQAAGAEQVEAEFALPDEMVPEIG